MNNKSSKVLVLEDEQGILHILEKVLKLSGYQVIGALNIQMARKALDECDVMLTDIRLGDECGLSFLEELREQGWNMPALVMSGSASGDEIRRALRLTGHDVVQKPLDFKVLVRDLCEITCCESTVH